MVLSSCYSQMTVTKVNNKMDELQHTGVNCVPAQRQELILRLHEVSVWCQTRLCELLVRSGGRPARRVPGRGAPAVRGDLQ